MDYKTSKRVALLKRMHNVMMNIDNEDYYMAWIYIMPDQPTEEDFLDIAEDEALFNEVLYHYSGIITKAIEEEEV